MSAAAPAFAPAVYPPQQERSSPAERLRLMLLWLVGVCGALVFIEPSPYEVASLAALVVFAASGLALRATLQPLAILLILINIGYTASANALLDQKTC